MEEGDQTDIILLDFAKAFDKVPHDRLLYEMEFYGVRQNTLKWIKQFLTNRTQSVILENQNSISYNSLSWGTLSKALAKSSNMMSVWSPSSMFRVMSSMVISNWDLQDL
jgi:hypothetical protein